jgi:aspartyl-tRNA(Asn)/glutamyl-tRNA(Gln) amidotransferase subunit B
MKIGLEVHVSLPLKSKLFCSCSSSATEPNTAICPICMGFPGSKPVLNEEAVAVAKKIADALNCKVNDTISFVRKVYFYPDLPKSYQITQTEMAVGYKGYVELSKKKIGITRVQIEEDPAKIMREADYTLLDFNRSGKGLVEIVTDPDMTSEEELREFLIEIRSILYYLGVGIEEELKADLNVSIVGDRVETKNVTGVNNIIQAFRYEVARQQALIGKHQEIKRETRSYDEASMKTVSSREKETEEEYGFIYDPDLTKYKMAGKKEKAVFASKIAKEYAKKYNFSETTIREMIMFSKESLNLMERAVGKHAMQQIVNGLELLKKFNKIDIGEQKFEELLKLIEEGVPITKDTIGKLEAGKAVARYSKTDEEQINKEIIDMIKSNGNLIKEYETNKKVFNFIVGKVAKKHNVDPRQVASALENILKDEFKLS